jgi:hypothetical protein
MSLSSIQRELNIYLAENHLDKITTKLSLNKEILKQFPTKIYQRRGLEKTLRDFLKEHQKVLISGWAGSGKSSLLLYTLYKYKCIEEEAYYFHFETHKFNQINIPNEISNQLIDNANSFLRKTYINSNPLYESFIYYCSMLTRINFPLVNRQIFIDALNNPDMYSVDDINIRIESLKKQLENNNITFNIFAQDINNLLNNNITNLFYALISFITYYLQKYIYFIYDNIDTETLQIQTDVLTAINQTIFPNANEKFKIVVLLRNTNLYDAIAPNANINQGVHRFHISLNRQCNNKDLFQKERSAIFDIYLTRMRLFFQEKKLKLVNNKRNEEIKNKLILIIETFKKKENELGILHSNIFKLSNHSIRFALKFINDFASWIIKNELDKNINNMPSTYIHSILFAYLSADKYDGSRLVKPFL